jgi:hypothetical protein
LKSFIDVTTGDIKMILNNFIPRSAITLGMVGFVFSGAAFANKDVIYPSSATATVDASSVAVTNNFVTGANGHTTLDNAVYDGDAVAVTAKWSIKDNRTTTGAAQTDYSSARTVNFTVSSVTGPESFTPTLTGTPCTGITSAGADKCTTEISFTAPATVGNYQVVVTTSSQSI